MEELRRYEITRQAAPAPNITMLVPSVPLYCSRHNFFFNLRFSDSNCLSRALRALLSSGPGGDAESGLSPPSFPPPPTCSIGVSRYERFNLKIFNIFLFILSYPFFSTNHSLLFFSRSKFRPSYYLTYNADSHCVS